MRAWFFHLAGDAWPAEHLIQPSLHTLLRQAREITAVDLVRYGRPLSPRTSALAEWARTDAGMLLLERWTPTRQRHPYTAERLWQNRLMPAYIVTSDPGRVNVDAVHQFLATSYWARGIPKHLVERAISNSVCFSVLAGDEQVGFARVVTDKATFAYLADVYILEAHRGKGLSRRLMEAVRDHPDLQGLRRMMLATRDAHGLYSRFGFKTLATPDRFMEAHNPAAYEAFARL